MVESKRVNWAVEDMRVEKGPQFQTYYSNIANVFAGPHDIAVTFSEVIETGFIQEKCRVVMVPGQARLLVKAILESLQKRAEIESETDATSSTEPEPQP